MDIKKEILHKHTQGHYVLNSTVHAAETDILKAMDEYAKIAIAEHEASQWHSFYELTPIPYARIIVIFPPESKQKADLTDYDPDADDYQDGDIWAYLTDLLPEPYQKVKKSSWDDYEPPIPFKT